jgi:group I intron endonuclease
MKKIGIYKITSPSGKIYIGQSVDINKRFTTYKNLDCIKQHILYKSLIKYGYENHKFEILIICNVDELNTYERYYQDLFSTIGKDGMNLKLTQTNDKNGYFSESIKNKISEANRKRIVTDETKRKIALSRTGKKLSEEHKLKISLGGKGKKISDETREKISESQKGKKLTKEHCIKISQSKKGLKFSDEIRLKFSLAQKGRNHSEETKNKISKAHKGKILSQQTKDKLSLYRKGKKTQPHSEETKLKIKLSHLKRHENTSKTA